MNSAVRRGLAAGILLIAAAPVAAQASPLTCQLRAQRLSTSALPTEYAFSALVAEGTPPYTVHWEFGDGASGDGASVQHTYTEAASRTVILTVTDASATPAVCADSTQVLPGFEADPACIANASTRWGPAPLMVNFVAEGVFVPPGPLEWVWSFGDGTTSTLWAPLHVFTQPGTYWVALQVFRRPWWSDCLPVVRVTALPPTTLGVAAPQPDGVRLDAPRPNPSRGDVTLEFTLPRAGRVNLRVTDLTGRTIATLVDGERAAGPQAGTWRGRTNAGGAAPAGLYFARLKFEDASHVARMIWLR
jgi:hypothetical protein